MKKLLPAITLIMLCLTACGEKNTSASASQTSSSSREEATASQSSSLFREEATASQSPSSSREEIPMSQVSSPSRDNASGRATGYRLMVPEAFSRAEIEQMEFYYAAEDGSSISLNIQDKDPDFQALTEERLSQALSDSLERSYSEKPAVTDNYFTTGILCGYPSYQYCVSYTLMGDEMTQTILGIDADRTYTFTYTDMTGLWQDAFNESLATVTLTGQDTA